MPQLYLICSESAVAHLLPILDASGGQEGTVTSPLIVLSGASGLGTRMVGGTGELCYARMGSECRERRLCGELAKWPCSTGLCGGAWRKILRVEGHSHLNGHLDTPRSGRSHVSGEKAHPRILCCERGGKDMKKQTWCQPTVKGRKKRRNRTWWGGEEKRVRWMKRGGVRTGREAGAEG